MRELVTESRECNVCGSRAWVMREAPDAGARGVTFAGRSGGGRLARVTRERSGLAHAAGFAGVLFLFGGPLARFALSHWGLLADAAACAAFACSLSAPLALGLAFA